MNILFLSNIVTPYQLDFLEELNNQSNVKAFGYFLFSKEQNRDWDLKLPEYVTVVNFNKKISDYKNLHQFIKNNKIDKTVIGGYTLPSTYFLMFQSKIQKIDLYFWLERPINEQVGLKKYLKEVYLKLTLGRAKKVFAIGKLASEIYKKYNDNIVNLPYCMNLEKFYSIKRYTKQSETINFLFSGQYIDRKNIINTINAFKQVDNEKIRLNIIGGGELKKEVTNLIKDDNRISDLGFVQPHMLSEIYSKNDVFLMPSKYDGWALVINEAMAAGMPVISTNKVGAVAEYIQHGTSGFICDESRQSIQNGIEFYCNRRDLISEHGKYNRELIKDSLGDVNNMTKEFVKQLEK